MADGRMTGPIERHCDGCDEEGCTYASYVHCWRFPAKARAALAEKDAEIKALREMAKTEKDYADAEERYFALPFDDRTKAEQGKLLAAYDARAAARAQVQP